jgi:serine/threonine protein kinase
MSTFQDAMSTDSPQTSVDTLSSSPTGARNVTPNVSMDMGGRASSTGSVQPAGQFNSQQGQKTIADGRFAVLETLGSGATGKVKLGVDTRTGERVALKIMARKLTSKRQGEQIRREVEAMTTLRHPNVLALGHVEMELKYPKHDGTFRDCILLVIELAGGGELFDFMM